MRSSKRNSDAERQKSHKARRVRRNDQSAKPIETGRRESPKGRRLGNGRKFSQADLFQLEIAAYRRICKAVNTPYSNSMLAKVDAGDWLGIAKAPMPDTESPSFPDDYLVQQIMRKNPRMPLQIDRKKAAVDKFWATESACRETNRILSLCVGDFATTAKASLAIHPRVLHRIRTTIKDILGPLTRAKLDYVEAKSRFGPGATYHCSSKNLTANKKLKSAIGLTPSLYRFVGCIEPHGWVQTTSGYRITAGSKATTVSKDATTDRFIAIEPSLNMRWQLGVGALIRRQLRRIGMDLRNQADKNRLRVRFAQATGLATIDLESASDTIARLLIAFLLPKEWSCLISTFRSPEMRVDGKQHTLEKISSMGNGFTFELETLVFYAIAKAFDEDPYVFGDDIIVRQDVAASVIRTLNVFGFSVNGKKTFLAGSFFESCGSDYWRGRNVRPFFFKKDAHEDLTSAVIRMANAVRRYAHRRNSGNGCDDRFLPVWLYLISRCQVAKRTAVPEGYGDVGLIRNFDEATPKKLRNGHCGFTARSYGGRPVEVDVTETTAGVFAALDTYSPRETGRYAGGIGPVFKNHWRGHPEARQFGAPTPDLKWYCTTFEWYGYQSGDWFTGGPGQSRSFQSVRGRIGKMSLRTMPVLNWHELGPWQ